MLVNFNYSKLLGLIKERGFTQAVLAKTINISESSLNQKLKNVRSFTQEEILNIAIVLKIEPSKINDYFFCEES